MRHLMSPLDFSVEELDELLNLANDIEKDPKKYAHACDGKKLATCFYEPSTRTRLSFVTQTSVRCVIQKKEPLLLLLFIPIFQLSMPETAVINILHKLLPIY